MTEFDIYLDDILHRAKAAAGVPVYHAPTSSAGEKIIWRTHPIGTTPPEEGLTLVMKFISGDGMENQARAAAVSRAILSPEDKTALLSDGSILFGIGCEEGESGYIGQTGHFYLTVRYKIRRLLPTGGTSE